MGGRRRRLSLRDLFGAAILAGLIVCVEVLLVFSYVRGSEVNAEFGGTSNFLTSLANVQREVLRLQVEVEHTVHEGVALDDIDLQRGILESQLRVLAAASRDLPEGPAGFEQAVATLPEVDRLMNALRSGADYGVVGPELEEALAQMERDVKAVFDRQEFAYFERTSESLSAQQATQLLLIVVAVVIAVLGGVLGVFIWRRVRGEFARAYYRLEAEMAERLKAQELLQFQASHDSLTGLANRALFVERLEAAVADPSAGVAVMFIDLDDFKIINDTRGHSVGDRMLTAVAQRIEATLRPGDVAARLGGDEFAVILTDVSQGHAAQVAGRLLAAFSKPFLVGGEQVVESATIGVAEAPVDGAPISAADLLRNADVAMYAAKAGGKNRVAVFHAELHQEAIQRLTLRGDLERAIGRDELVLHYQPIVELASGRVVALEALVRWQHPERGLLGPMQFIPLAEESGIIAAIDRWVLREASREGARRGVPVAVNLSARQMQSDSPLVDDVAAALRDSKLEPGALTLELTEGVLVADLPAAAEVFRRLKALGVRLAIDDFGTGFSSLSYLSRFPIDVLKIDKSFVQVGEADASHVALARTIVGLGPVLGLDTVAEGIELPEQLDLMIDLGCRFGQGFLLSPPVDAERLDEVLARIALSAGQGWPRRAGIASLDLRRNGGAAGNAGVGDGAAEHAALDEAS